MNTDHLRWIVEWCTETASLLFAWDGTIGRQYVLMPGYRYYWWLDDTAATLHERTESSRGRERDPHVH